MEPIAVGFMAMVGTAALLGVVVGAIGEPSRGEWGSASPLAACLRLPPCSWCWSRNSVGVSSGCAPS
jgi:hypothetical protein